VRLKPRLRAYRTYRGETPRSVYLELKGRFGQIVTKRRVPVDRGLAERSLSSGPLNLSGSESESAAMGEFLYLAHRFHLAPCVSVFYHRAAYFGAFYPDVRMTFDRVVQCSRDTSLDTPDDAFIYAIPANWLVIELKYNDKIPAMLLRRFRSLGLQRATFSKFAASLDRTHDAMFAPRFVQA
jgi:hypothetical protein